MKLTCNTEQVFFKVSHLEISANKYSLQSKDKFSLHIYLTIYDFYQASKACIRLIYV